MSSRSPPASSASSSSSSAAIVDVEAVSASAIAGAATVVVATATAGSGAGAGAGRWREGERGALAIQLLRKIRHRPQRTGIRLSYNRNGHPTSALFEKVGFEPSEIRQQGEKTGIRRAKVD